MDYINQIELDWINGSIQFCKLLTIHSLIVIFVEGGAFIPEILIDF